MSRVGADAIAEKGWLVAHRWLILRRLVQFGLLGLFLLGPLAGVWIVKGNLNYSLTLGVLPLSDPYVMLQSVLTGHVPESQGLIGTAIVLVFYALIGGRAFCAWVCPINPLTDAASGLRRRLHIKGGAQLSRDTRYWILGLSLVLSAVGGSIAWEWINPVSMLHRGLLFGMGAAWTIVLGIFLLELFVSKNGWCGRLCPVGAFYNLLGRFSLLCVSASQRTACNDCMDCFEVCPELQVIRPALKGAEKGVGPVILDANCTNCGRCIDVCSKDVFNFDLRFNNPAPPGIKSASHAAAYGNPST